MCLYFASFFFWCVGLVFTFDFCIVNRATKKKRKQQNASKITTTTTTTKHTKTRDFFRLEAESLSVSNPIER